MSMEKFLNWRIVLRLESPWSGKLPVALATLPPPFRHPALPEEVGLLLPNRDSLRPLLDRLSSAPPGKVVPPDSALGLFLADPFLHPVREAPCIAAAGVAWVVNLPSVEQQDREFSQQLADVGLDGALERERLGALKQAGFRVLAVVSDAEGAAAAAMLAPEALIVLPRVGDFAAGFPSFRQRGAAAQAVATAARAAGWSGPVLGLGKEEEAGHERIWPEALDGLVLRPREG